MASPSPRSSRRFSPPIVEALLLPPAAFDQPEPRPRVQRPIDQFVRIAPGGEAKLSARHAGVQVVDGPPVEVQLVVAAHAARLAECLAPIEVVQLRTRLLVSPTGKVVSVGLDGTLIPDAAPCVRDVLTSISFPARVGGPRSYRYTVIHPPR